MPAADSQSTSPATQQQSEQELRMQKGVLPAILGLAAVIAVAGPAALYFIARQSAVELDSLNAYLLPILLIGGIVMFLLAISIVVIVFRKLGLASSSHALGLPEGSIRAFIALALILLFFMMAVYLYAGISKQPVGEVIKGLSTEAAAAIPDELVAFRVPQGALVDVHMKAPAPAGEDLAQQMITTMSTLVVAVASFYFGSSSVQQALGGVGGDQAAKDQASAAVVRRGDQPVVDQPVVDQPVVDQPVDE